MAGKPAPTGPAPRVARAGAPQSKPVVEAPPAPAPMPSVEIIRGDKRSTEVIK
jgi:hypothetical protein